MHRFTSNKGIELIKKFEGFSKTKYICAGGYPTIGYGHRLLKNEKYDILSVEDATKILANDLFDAEKAILRYINAPLTDNQFDALVSFTFNCGAAALQRSTLRQKINYLLYDEIGDELMKWVRIGTKVIRGLVCRRTAEKFLFSGEL